MSFGNIIGQPLAVEISRKWLNQKTTNPLLLYGPEGVGKRTLALELAKALNCRPAPSPLSNGRGLTPGAGASAYSLKGSARKPDQGVESCDECPNCRKISAGNHPDVRVIDFAWQAAEKKEPIEKQQNIKIETVMTERHRLLQRPAEGAWKVSILEDAHRLTPDAANVLLKILEEPPANTAIFLVTPFRDRLFATIVSRCQPVRFRALSDDEMALCLSRLMIPAQDHAKLTEMSLGSPGRAMHFSREEQIESVQEAERLWELLGKVTPAGALHEGGGRPRSAKPNRTEIEGRIHSLLVPAARALRSGDARAKRPVEAIQNALTRLRQNVQPALVYDYLLLQLAEARK